MSLTEIETDKPYETDKPELYIQDPPDFHAWCFFLVEEYILRASEAGQVSQPVQACQPGLGDPSKPTAPAYFWEVKLMFVNVTNFDQIKKIRFIVVKIFWSYFNKFSFLLIWSSKLASFKSLKLNFFFRNFQSFPQKDTIKSAKGLTEKNINHTKLC